MRYVGGKVKIAGWIAENVLPHKGDKTTYLEPFLGSASTFAKIAPHFKRSIASDAHPDLMLMWQALVNGKTPPNHVSRETYESLRFAEPSALRGLVGFGSSFSGKWFGGYTDVVFDKHVFRNTKPFLATAVRSFSKVVPALKMATLCNLDYKQHNVTDDFLVYCDPPYRGTQGYGGLPLFDSDQFWEVAESWANIGATVIVSEENAPSNWRVIASRQLKHRLKVSTTDTAEQRSEKLWMLAR